VQLEQQTPRTPPQITALLRDEGERWAMWVDCQFDDFLAEGVELPSGMTRSKTRFEMLLGTKEHEMHHRGQLMLIERILGIVTSLDTPDAGAHGDGVQRFSTLILFVRSTTEACR
jgi:uncharacterized damage-inducible protein DinB